MGEKVATMTRALGVDFNEARAFSGGYLRQPFQAADGVEIGLQQQAAAEREHLSLWNTDRWREMEGPMSWSAFWQDRLIAVGGLIEHWPGLARAWIMFDESLPGRRINVHLTLLRDIRALLDHAQSPMPDGWGYRRIEATCDVSWAQAAHLLEVLGFQREATLRRYDPCGRTHHLYARISP